MRRGTVVFVTSSFPFGDGESFLGPELESVLQRQPAAIVPVWPRGAPRTASSRLAGSVVAAHPAALTVVALGVLEGLRRPVAAIRAVRRLVAGPPRTCLRNLAVTPKAFWLARRIRKGSVRHVHAYWAGLPATVAMVAASLGEVTWSMTAHRGDVLSPNLLPEKVGSASFTRCVAEATARVVRGQVDRGDVPHPRLPVVHLGVQVPRLDGPRPATAEPLTALCVAALTPRKGHEVLLRALARCRADGVQLLLDLAGSGRSETQLRRSVEGLGLDGAVRFLGQLSHDDLLERYQTSEVGMVVLASSSEGIPVALMEAMAYRIPVIGTDAGGTAELVGGGAGLLVEVGDVDALADAMAALANDPALRGRLAEAGRRRIEASFEATACARELLRAIDEWSSP